MSLYLASPKQIDQLLAQRIALTEGYIREAGQVITHYMKSCRKLEGFDLSSAKVGYHIDKGSGEIKPGNSFDDSRIRLNDFHCPYAQQAFVMVRKHEIMKQDKTRLHSFLNNMDLFTHCCSLKTAWFKHPWLMSKIHRIWSRIEEAHQFFEGIMWQLKRAAPSKTKLESQQSPNQHP